QGVGGPRGAQELSHRRRRGAVDAARPADRLHAHRVREVGQSGARHRSDRKLAAGGGFMRIETFALFCGVATLSLGLLGLQASVPDSVIHLAIGAWGITAWRHWTQPRVFSGTLAI